MLRIASQVDAQTFAIQCNIIQFSSVLSDTVLLCKIVDIRETNKIHKKSKEDNQKREGKKWLLI